MGDSGNSLESSTFKLYASNFMARDIHSRCHRLHLGYGQSLYQGEHIETINSSVLQSTFEDIIAPEGWDAWDNAGKEESITYAEVDCYGPGANKSKRVKWEKTLSSEEVKKFIYAKLFLNQDNWIEEQLKHV
ncbi:putative pectinesterase 11 [Quercus suber]|uniref:pectinesterase n=1 Tax=Quercus suber TaxID=58331 RepID=A0AAW0LR40_QUESU